MIVGLILHITFFNRLLNKLGIGAERDLQIPFFKAICQSVKKSGKLSFMIGQDAERKGFSFFFSTPVVNVQSSAGEPRVAACGTVKENINQKKPPPLSAHSSL